MYDRISVGLTSIALAVGLTRIALAVGLTLAAIVIAWLWKRRSEAGIRKRATFLPDEPVVDTGSSSEEPVIDAKHPPEEPIVIFNRLPRMTDDTLPGFKDDSEEETVIANLKSIKDIIASKSIPPAPIRKIFVRGWEPVQIIVDPSSGWAVPPPPLDPVLDVQQPKVIYYGHFPLAYSEHYPDLLSRRALLTKDSKLVLELLRHEQDGVLTDLTEADRESMSQGSVSLDGLWSRGPTMNEIIERVILGRAEELSQVVERELVIWRKSVAAQVRDFVTSGGVKLTPDDLEKITELGQGTFSALREAVAIVESRSREEPDKEPDTLPPPPKE